MTAALSVPTIGIGAGPDCDGQVLVSHDMLGLFDGQIPSFVKQYAHLADEVDARPRASTSTTCAPAAIPKCRAPVESRPR